MAGAERTIDLLVLGGGTAGIVGAKTAARFGARTVLVEMDRTGGDCLWTGCVPSKTLLSAAGHAGTVRKLTGEPPRFPEIRDRIAAAIATIEPVDSPAALEAEGVEVIKGQARFVGPRTAEVNGTRIRFRQALLATGGAPTRLELPGLDRDRVVTSETVWDLQELPARLVIIGGGPIACELGQAFARLGSEVTMVARSRILSKEDAEAADIIRHGLATDGVRVMEHCTVKAASTDAGGVRLDLSDGSTVGADTVLTAAGRTPRTEGLGLEHLGVQLDDRGHVLTDDRMRTHDPRIWAAGDVTANPQFTHLAGVHSSVAASNAVLGVRRTVSATVPRVTFTSPEVAAVGLTEADTGKGQRTRTVQHEHVDRAVTDQQTRGFTRLIIDRSGKILGGTIVGPRAGESLAELTLAVQKELTTSDIAGTTHPYPTYADGVWNAAVADVRDKLSAPLMSRATQALVWLRRHWLDRSGAQRSAR